MKKHNSMFGMYMYLFFLSNEKNVNLLRGDRKKERKKKRKKKKERQTGWEKKERKKKIVLSMSFMLFTKRPLNNAT